ncbi:MAG: beta-L-arabinofuranosidase domain-containing protein [Pirellulales bacterium]
MKSVLRSLFVFVVFVALSATGSVRALAAEGESNYTVAAVPHKDVTITDTFWTPRIENNRTVTIPDLLGRSGRGGANLRVVEAACYSLVHHPDGELRALLESKVDPAIAGVRRGKGQWSQSGDGSLPGPGYFLEAAVAYQELTGSRKMLDVAIEVADDINAVFGPGRRHDISNHEGIKNGLVRLCRATGDPKYLKLAQFFLDRRGNPEHREIMYGPYAQDHKPIVEQDRAIGHAVRATYLYMALTDIAALSGNPAYRHANERIWQDAVSKRTYLTGGVGTYRDEEDFSDDFDLPNLSTWNEICAAFGAVMWNHKMYLVHNDAAYIDMLERTLYNGFLVGISLDAKTYLYQAPLRSYGDFARHPSFGPNCCPPNVARLFPQLGGMIYAQDKGNVYVNLYVASKAKVALDSTVEIVQETRYPWDGAVKLTINPAAPRQFALNLRIPGWARSRPMPGGLYRHVPSPADASLISLKVNGAKVDFTIENRYVKLDRQWKAGDTVELEIPMPVRRVVARDSVADDVGMVALERGPLVYCLEQADNSDGVFNVVLPDDAKLDFQHRPDLLGGIGTIKGNARGIQRIQVNQATDGAGGPTAARTVGRTAATVREIVAIPYYAFANRGKGEMSVWLAREDSKAWIEPAPSIASTSKATSSVGDGTVAQNYPRNQPPTVARRFYPISQDGSGSIKAIYDQLEPTNSEDGSAPYLRIRPQSGDQAWVQYDFAKPSRVSSVEVYWKDDKQCCIAPKSWRLLAKQGDEWKPVTTSDNFGVAIDQFNRVSFEPITAAGLRMEITLRPKVYPRNTLGPPDGNYLPEDLTWFEGGVIEWRVNP